jgi:hypothetical protein
MIIKHIIHICGVLLVFIFTSILLFLPSILSLIGLSTSGPIAGGLFASMQGAGIASGSIMSILQSVAMSGWAVVIQIITISGWIIISAYAFVRRWIKCCLE